MTDLLNEISFWNLVNSLIKKKNLTQRSLSTLCDFAERRIESLSSYNRLPTIFECYKIAKILDVTVEYLVTGENTDHSEKIAKIKSDLLGVIQDLDSIKN